MFDKSLIPTISRLRIPERYSVDLAVDGFRVTCMASPQKEVSVTLEPFRSRGPTCRRVLARTENGDKLIIEFATFNDEYDPDISGVIRARQPLVNGDVLISETARFREPPVELSDITDIREQARTSWTEGIAYRTEITNDTGAVLRAGLRLPQVGALHAVASHWTLGHDPAIVVMPTGTGKTEVMIAASVATACDRLLVIIPTDALREQTASKFQTYGLLREIGIIGALPHPVVGFGSA